MIQQYINKIANKNIFKNIPTKVSGKFVNNNTTKNKYADYLNNSKISTDMETFLQSICYNTDHNNIEWNQKIKYLYFYNKVNNKLIQTLNDKLINKIYNNIKHNEVYMNRIYGLLTNYHMLFDKDGNEIPLNKYPRIYYVGAYIEAYTTIYLTVNLTDSEIKELSLMTSGVNILINKQNYIQLIKLRGKTKNKINDNEIIKYKFKKTHSDIIKLLITMTDSNFEIKNKDDIEKIYNKLNIIDN